MHIDLAGNIAVGTGPSGQLGRVMARTLAGCGADVAVHYHRNRPQAEAVRDEMSGMGRRALAGQADVTNAAAVMAMRDAMVITRGHPTSSSPMR